MFVVIGVLRGKFLAVSPPPQTFQMNIHVKAGEWTTIAHKSCPEYEQLKLLLHNGKSATMLPSITASSNGH